MLTPEYLDSLPEPVLKLFRQVEEDILEDMARRISKMEAVTATADWQRWRLEQLGETREFIYYHLQRLTGKTQGELNALFQEAGGTALYYDDQIYRAFGLTPGKANENPELLQLLNAGARQTQQSFQNLTRTTANTATQQFERALDRAWLQVSSGAFNYQAAIRTAIKSLASTGMQAIQYPTGHIDTLEVAVRRAVLTGVGKTTGEICLAHAEEMGCDLMEITAHPGARPSHMVWQGKIVSLSGRKGYLSKSDIGYGTGAGFKGWNCRHDWFPYFEGLSESAYPREKLREYENQTVTYNGKTLSYYDATQQQRYMERQIRRWKREYKMMDAAGQDTTQASMKLAKWRAAEKDFCKQTGLDRDGFRSQVEGFGRSEASRAMWENKKQQAIIDRFTQKMESNGYHVSGFSDYVGDARTLEEMQSAFEKISQLYPDESKGLTIALTYTDDPDTLGWFDPKTGRIHFSREQFKNWEAAQKEYDELVKVGFFPQGTDLRGCFYHEFGHSFSYQRGWKSYRKAVDQTLESLGYGHMSVALRESALRKELSEYAITETTPSYQEVIAECFSEWYNSDKPRRFCELFLRKVGAL